MTIDRHLVRVEQKVDCSGFGVAVRWGFTAFEVKVYLNLFARNEKGVRKREAGSISIARKEGSGTDRSGVSPFAGFLSSTQTSKFSFGNREKPDLIHCSLVDLRNGNW